MAQLANEKISSLAKNTTLYPVLGGVILICVQPHIYLCQIAAMDKLLGVKGKKTSHLLTRRSKTEEIKFATIKTSEIAPFFTKIWEDQNIKVDKRSGWLSLYWINSLWSYTVRGRTSNCDWNHETWANRLHLQLTVAGWNVPDAPSFVVPNTSHLKKTLTTITNPTTSTSTTTTTTTTTPLQPVPRTGKHIIPTLVEPCPFHSTLEVAAHTEPRDPLEGITKKPDEYFFTDLKVIWSEYSSLERPWGWFFECDSWTHPIDDEYFVSTYRKWILVQSQIYYPSNLLHDSYIAGKGPIEDEHLSDIEKDPIHSQSRSGDDTDLDLYEVTPAYWESHQVYLDALEDDDNTLDSDFVGLFGNLNDLGDAQLLKMKYLISSQIEYETCRYNNFN